MVRTVALALLALLTLVPAALAADPPPSRTYQKRFTKDAYLSDREDLLNALAAEGTPAAREAIVWCLAKQREFLDAADKESDKAAAKLKPLQVEFDELLRKHCEQTGNPAPTSIPVWPVTEKLNAARADLQEAEKRVAEQRAVRILAVDCHGRCVDAMKPDQQAAYRETVVKGPLAAKDWPPRAETYELLRAAKAPWVTEILVAAARDEADPRALCPAIDALAGRDPAVVVPVVAARIDDARWLVRAAVLAALEATPSREAIDAIVARAPKEEGRLRDDCLRILDALTGADVTRTPEAWKRWWDENRAAWSGPPPKASASDSPEKQRERANRDAARRAEQAKGATGGFFGIQTSSKRVCYVIDVSGSMHEKAAEGGKETRAETAKAELIRALRGLEDGSLFALVLFSSDVRVWKQEMTVASEETRKTAVAFVEAAPVVGATNTYGALEAAFSLGEPSKQKPTDPYADPKLDTIIFLSDGKPTNGRTTRTEEIRSAVREWNKRRRVTIHAIAFGKDADFPFMKALATDTGGVFVSP